MYRINPDDMPTPELRDLVRKVNDMERELFGKTVKIRLAQHTYYPWTIWSRLIVSIIPNN